MIEMVFGIILSVVSPQDTATDPASMIYKGIITAGKIEKKTENEEWGPSFYEEIHILTKDSIYKLGGLK